MFQLKSVLLGLLTASLSGWLLSEGLYHLWSTDFFDRWGILRASMRGIVLLLWLTSVLFLGVGRLFIPRMDRLDLVWMCLVFLSAIWVVPFLLGMFRFVVGPVSRRRH